MKGKDLTPGLYTRDGPREARALILAVFILFWLVVPMPVNAAGSSDKKDGVTAAQPQSPKVPTVQSARNLVVSEKKGLLSLKAVNAELGQVLAALSKESGVPIKLVDQAEANTKITISFQNLTIQAALNRVMSTLSAGGFASITSDNKTDQTIYVVTKKGADIKAWLFNVSGLVSFIKDVGRQDVTCEQTYWELSALKLGAENWWQKASNVEKLLDAAKSPELSTCSRMASLELYMAKLSKDEMQKQARELQTFFGNDDVPDKLIGRLAQLFAEREVPPTLLIETILENDKRGQAARSHAWYAAGKTQTHSPHLLDLAIQDANSNDPAHSVSGKMALEYLSSSRESAITPADGNKVKELIAQVVSRAIELPNDATLNELGRSIAAVSAIPRFFPKAEVVPFLGQVVVKASNDNVKLTALDTMLTIRTAYESEVGTQVKEIAANLETVFTDDVSRERAKARLKMLAAQR